MKKRFAFEYEFSLSSELMTTAFHCMEKYTKCYVNWYILSIDDRPYLKK